VPTLAKPSFVALTGFMGSGKSSVGRALALLLSWNFVDLDSEIERQQGRKIRDIFAAEGEPRFREMESATLRSILARPSHSVVLATGGGTFVQPGNAELLRAAGALVIFLETSPELLLRRCCGSNDPNDSVRPLARDRDAFLRLYERRLPLYRTADLTVPSEHKSPDAVAREIAERIRLAQ
jgi:shikimate kinase